MLLVGLMAFQVGSFSNVVAFILNCIYLFYFKGIISAEVFDPIKNIWNFISNMSCKRSSVGVASLDGHVYAIGGYCGDSRQCLDSVERYNPKDNKWKIVENMSVRRSGPAVCTFDGKIYVFGGHGKFRFQKFNNTIFKFWFKMDHQFTNLLNAIIQLQKNGNKLQK